MVCDSVTIVLVHAPCNFRIPDSGWCDIRVMFGMIKPTITLTCAMSQRLSQIVR